MQIEPAYDADGSVAGWLCFRCEFYLGSFCRTGPRRWHANDSDGAVIAVTRTRREAVDAIRNRTATDKGE
jgi:hypothetical protein